MSALIPHSLGIDSSSLIIDCILIFLEKEICGIIVYQNDNKKNILMEKFNILLKEQIILSENLYLKKYPNADLVYNSALSIFNFIEKEFNKKKILFFCGLGNNGNDGRKVIEIGSKKNFFKLINIQNLGDYENQIEKCDIIIDAIFGFGLNRKINREIGQLIEKINKSKKKVISIDIPSGVFPDTGEILSKSIKANITLALGYFKPCHFLHPGKSQSGDLYLLDLRYETNQNRKPRIRLVDSNFLSFEPLKKKQNIHKYNKGSILVIGGKMSGAARIVALSARKIGAGLSTIKIEKGQLLNYAGTEPGTIVNFSKKIQVNDYDLVVIGPGLGKKYSLSKIIKTLRDSKKTLILDADALSIFEKKKEHLFSLLKKRTNTILTPHEGEFKRLFGEMKKDKLSAALMASKKTNSIIVFKGNDTVIACPNGDVFINNGANSSLATAGTGDMLCGMIGGLICQGMEVAHSILCAIYIQNKLSKNINNTTVEDFINDIPLHCNWLK